MNNLLFDGVEFVLDVNGNPAYRFEDVFRRFEGNDFSQMYEDVKKLQHGMASNRSHLTDSQRLSDAWGRLQDFHKAKVDKPGPWLNEAGVYKLAGDMNSKASVEFQRWRDTEVLPSIRKTGSYSSKANAFKSTGDEHADLAFLISTQAKELGYAILEAREGKRIALEVDAKVTQLDAKVSSAVDTLNNLTGGDFYKTAARFMSECHVKGLLSPGIKPDEANAKILGREATRLSRVYNRALGPEVIHGRFPVNSYEPDVLEQAARLCGFLKGSGKA
jgi:prophage antirepressor-like protein